MTTYTQMWDVIENKYKDKYGPYVDNVKDDLKLFELALVGRGGYGIWQGGELLVSALISSGKYGKSIFIMPGERRNSPTRSFVRYSDVPVSFPPCYIYKPDHLIVTEPGFLTFRSIVFDIDMTEQVLKMDENGLIIVNSSKSPQELYENADIKIKAKIATVDAAKIAEEILGNPFLTNTALMGAYIALTGVIPFENFAKAITNFKDPRGRNIYSGDKGKSNVKAAEAGYNLVKTNGNGLEGK